jgi:hypothetical protein
MGLCWLKRAQQALRGPFGTHALLPSQTLQNQKTATAYLRKTGLAFAQSQWEPSVAVGEGAICKSIGFLGCV